jgi:hypothetical protein
MKVISPARSLHEAFYAMGVLAHIPGGPHHIYFPSREPAARDHFDDIVALSSRMSWIRSVQRGLPPLQQYGLDLRPYSFKQEGRAMLTKMRYYCGIYEPKPWFERISSTRGHVVLSRTTVQQNPLFPWGALLAALHRQQLIFVGSSEEYAAFQPVIPDGVTITHMQANDWGGATLDTCLSASLYIGNHSPALAVVEGAHVPAITEVSLSNPDNIYLRPGSCPCFTNYAAAPDEAPVIGGGAVQSRAEGLLAAIYADWPNPPNGWKVDVSDRASRYFDTLEDACFYMCRHSPDLNLMNREYARKLILEENLKAFPEWADEAVAHRLFKKPALALRTAARKVKLRRYLPPVSSYLSDLCD